MIMPLSLTLLSAAVKPERRNAALGIWGAIGGAAIALGPLVGGAVTTGWSWHYIFWLNVPIGIVLVPLAWWKLAESRGAPDRLDLRGALLVSGGLLGVVLGLVRGNAVAGPAPACCPPSWSAVGTASGLHPLGIARHDADAQHADVPNRGFAAINVTAMLFSFGMFGTVFFLSQFLQTVQGYSPLGAGLRVLPWTGMPMLLAPVVGTPRPAFRGQAPRRHRASSSRSSASPGWRSC